jgi:hypothetical protein
MVICCVFLLFRKEIYMVWIIIAILAIIIWIIIGVSSSGAGWGDTPPPPSGPEKCDDCTGLKTWWNSLTPGQKASQAAWYNAKKTSCIAKGCKLIG